MTLILIMNNKDYLITLHVDHRYEVDFEMRKVTMSDDSGADEVFKL